MKLYGLKNCDTCRKALKELDNVTFVDVRDQGVPAQTLSRAFDQFGGALLNTLSTTWRGLDADERAKPPLELLTAHPTLMKRPLIEKDGALFLGWSDAVREALG
ncbi:ArsC/Spx/MgsR family protein [Shimia biformata]|uniref:ArsC/Spx/MgsR family protein n=1 Tax=Shimia biformata TaxID=1294299 RepID=UPI00194F9CE0|nr:ArsC/Spx/MgsR family protein [Shimia biformata]